MLAIGALYDQSPSKHVDEYSCQTQTEPVISCLLMTSKQNNRLNLERNRDTCMKNFNYCYIPKMVYTGNWEPPVEFQSDVNPGPNLATVGWGPSQYKDRLSHVWGFPY